MSEDVEFQNTSSQGDVAVQSALKIGLNVLKVMMVLLVVLWLRSGIYEVEKGEAAVAYYLGAIQPYEGQNVRTENVYWGLPRPFTKVIKIKVNKSYRVELDLYKIEDTTKGDIKEDPIVKHERMYNVTKDMNLIHLSWNISYKIKALDLFVQNLYQEGDMNKGHGKDKPWRVNAYKLIESVARGIIVAECRQNDAIAILTSRANFNLSVKEKLQLELDRLNSGIEITLLNLNNSEPPLSLKMTFEIISQVKINKNKLLSAGVKFSNEMRIRSESAVNQIMVDEENSIREMKKNVETEAFKLKELLKSFKGDPAVRRNYMEQIYLKTISNILYNSKIEYIDHHKRIRYKTTVFAEDKEKDKKKGQ